MRIDKSYADQITATVRGTRRYTVHLHHVGGDEYEFDCTCPYFIEHNECKHIWATLLAAEAQGHLLGPDHTLPSYIVEEDADEFHRSAGDSARIQG